jgi:hypothetical protein
MNEHEANLDQGPPSTVPDRPATAAAEWVEAVPAR